MENKKVIYIDNNDEFLWNNLVKLGDMMGDGLHLESDGKWIEKEYKKTLLLLGLLPKQKRNTADIDEYMRQRVAVEKCDCGDNLKQSRKGSFIVVCQSCGKKYRLGKRKR